MKGLRQVETFTITIRPATPFLVASGRTLTGRDYVIGHVPRTGTPLIRVIDFDRVIDDPRMPLEKKLEVIERRGGWNLDRYFRYTLACEFRRVDESVRLLECERDSEGRPRLPAPTVKGAIRTGIVFAILKQAPGTLGRAIERVGWRPERAAAGLEGQLFGRDTGRHPLRALRVGAPPAADMEDVRAWEVGLLNLQGQNFRTKYSFHVEAWSPDSGAAVEVPVSIDHGQVFRSAPRETRDILAGREKLLEALRRFSEALVERETQFYADVSRRELAPLWAEVVETASGRILLPLGFGTGWHTKTAGLLLSRDDLTGRLRTLLSRGRSHAERGGRILFPKTRRWILDAGRPWLPLGWTTWE